jgi:RNA polymerase sigma factor (sigma-70 family)
MKMSEKPMKTSELHLPFKDKVYRFVLNIVENTYDAEDIMQELMIKIWNRLDQYNTLDNKEAWCMTVARNMAIDKVRNKKTSTQDINEYHHISDQGRLQDKQLEQDESLSQIMKLVNQLPEKQRMVIHLRDVEGYSYQEIADMTETTLEFVKISLHRARKTLKEQLIKQNIRRYEV